MKAPGRPCQSLSKHLWLMFPHTPAAAVTLDHRALCEMRTRPGMQKGLFVGEVWKLDFFQQGSETPKISSTLMDGSTSTYPLCKTHLDFLKVYSKSSTAGCRLLVFSLLIRYYLASAPKLLRMDPTKVYRLWKYTWTHTFILESFRWH